VYTSAELAAAAVSDQTRGHALRLAAVVTAAGDSPLAGSHRSAAILHGLDVIERQPGELVTVTRSRRHGGSRSGKANVHVHYADLPPHHLVTVAGVVVTSVARTVVDLARECSFAEGVVIADSALRAEKTTAAEINSVLAECERWPGLVQARRVAAFSDRRSESALESIGRVAFHEHGLPPPDLQVVVGCEVLGVIGRADFLWPKHATIAEADGALKYADPSRAIGRLDRDERLRQAGFEVVHFTWQEITTAPWQVVARVEAAFARAEAR
jgi:hypothetical protein